MEAAKEAGKPPRWEQGDKVLVLFGEAWHPATVYAVNRASSTLDVAWESESSKTEGIPFENVRERQQ